MANTVTAAWQRWLELEDEAVWTYPVIGARITALTSAVDSTLAAHTTVRSVLLARFDREGWSVPATPAGYDIGTVDTPAQAKTAAQSVENRITAAIVALVAVTKDEDRAYAVAALRRSAATAVTWGAAPTALPGLAH